MFSLKSAFPPLPICLLRMRMMYLLMNVGTSLHLVPRYTEWWAPAPGTQLTRVIELGSEPP